MINVGTPAVAGEWTPCPHGELPPVATSRRKRVLDVVVASLALVTLLPLLLLITCAVLIESRGPAFFRQERSGLGGKRFQILKFRTMYVQPEADAIRQATIDDSRVTAVGRVLRRLSLDELPQLLNVLGGDMSLIGPRPHAVSHDLIWSDVVPEYVERFRTRPGLTGLAQVRGYRGEVRTLDCIVNRVRSDNEYVDLWSLRLDLEIFAGTLKRMFRDPAAY